MGAALAEAQELLRRKLAVGKVDQTARLRRFQIALESLLSARWPHLVKHSGKLRTPLRFGDQNTEHLHGRLREEVLQILLAQTGERLHRLAFGGHLEYAIRGRAAHAAHLRLEELFLALEVIIKSAFGSSEARGNRRHRCRGIALLEEDFARDGKDRLAALVARTGTRRWCRHNFVHTVRRFLDVSGADGHSSTILTVLYGHYCTREPHAEPQPHEDRDPNRECMGACRLCNGSGSGVCPRS